MKKILFPHLLFTFLFLTGCTSLQNITTESDQLFSNEGYVGLVFNSDFNLRMVKIYAEDNSQPDIHISYILKGENLFIYKLPAGIYCIKRYAIGEIDVKILDGGICFEVIKGMMNYPGHIIASYDNTYFSTKAVAFVKILHQEYPVICKEFLLNLCNEKYQNIDTSKIRFIM